MKKQWFRNGFADSSKMIIYLNKLSDLGIQPECIKISETSFHMCVYYFHDKIVYEFN